jgi:predicted dehydrogenase
MKVGLMGAGFMGSVHADVYHRLEDVQLTAVLIRDKTKVSVLSEKMGCRIYTDMESFFKDGKFEIVDICLPTYLHEEMIKKALEAGKHVLCEKPLALSIQSANRIQRVVNEATRKFMVAQVIRFWPQYRKIREYVECGKIGSIESIYAYRLCEKPQWADWFRFPEKGGGALFDLHIHDVDFVYALCGKPKSLFSTGSRGEFGAWDSVSSILNWSNKHATIEGDWKYEKGFLFQFGIRIRGSEGGLEYRFRVAGNVESKDQALEEFIYTARDRVQEIDCKEYGDGFESEIVYFLDCVKNNKPVREATINDALEVLRLVEEEKASLETGERRVIMGP